MKRTSWVLALALVSGGTAKADVITYALPDVGNFSGYMDTNTSDTFTGNGFVGIYPAGGAGPAFAHLFGLEHYSGVFSETQAQVNIAALAGAHINSATLSYNLLDGAGESQTVTVTSFTTTGTLGYNETPPDNLGMTSFTSNGLSANSVDVTALLQAAVMSGNGWLGLFLTPNGPGDSHQWTYTSGFQGDEAALRLTVDYSLASPEPATLAVFGTLAAGAFGLRRRVKPTA
jgi:hypothetical protein